ncbi:MAG: S8 family serine peptidase [Oscillatoria sp. PMC 1051.18]|nr:S8 family serine peptidase [Oscillatoria sp. PMC 1050.18]MEC5030098.1 S8 family serine peptidase [Oscillatoria sp. PMC 1051.18]
MRKNLALLVSGLAALSAPALALDTSVGQGGINARRLHEAPYNLTGRKIAIGQVEIGRPGLFGLDKVVSWNPALSLAGVFHRDSPAESNKFVDTHAGMVAAVMVSGDKDLRGVAPDARLYASAVGSLRRGGQPEECLSSQHVALQNNDDVRAINYSFGESLRRDPRPEAILDGNALLTRCVDWSARVHDVLYVIAGNQGSGGIPIPTDLYNGITTAYTTERDGVFTKIDFANLSDLPEGIGRSLIEREINIGPRRAISLVAPGSNITVFDLDGKLVKVSGTSFAAPHITASVALLQEFGDRQLKQNASNWSVNSRRHEVMKAVLLNSAEKVQDPGDGSLLGMNRTIRTKDNRTWFEGDAAQDPKIPLDIQMGTGHVNVFRAYQQFSGGQWGPESSAPALGWDYRTVEADSSQDYELEQPLQKGSYAAVTLAWDRLVELNDENNNDRYDLGEDFRDRGLNNLDVYLMSIDSNDPRRSVCASVSDADSVEHIFCQVPETGRYKIRVQYRSQVNEKTQVYGLAWWTKPAQ